MVYYEECPHGYPEHDTSEAYRASAGPRNLSHTWPSQDVSLQFRSVKDFRSLIAGIKTSFLFFRKSGTAAELLAVARKRAANPTLSVLLDFHTRWGSIFLIC
jgi:hypothetical protein